MNDATPPLAPQPVLGKADVRIIIIGVLLAMLLAALDQTIVATALPTIGNELKDVEHLQWVVTAYLLSGTAVTPLYGKLADIYGRRTVMLTAIAIFLGGSILCALARSMLVLVVARFVQGLGGGGLIALAQTIVADVVAPRERMRYQAYFASVFVTASVVGPVFGGFFAQHLHWSFIFWINLPLGALALAMTSGVLKRLPRRERPHKLDVIGALLMAFAATALLLGLSWGGSTFPWGSWQVIGLFAASLVAWVLFAARLLTAAEPFVPLAVMYNPVVATGTLSNFFVVGTMVALTIFVPIYFEAVLGLTSSESGLALIAFMGGTVAGAQLAGRIMVWSSHYKLGPLVGLAVSVVCMAWLAFRASSMQLWEMEVALAIGGTGMGTIFPVTTVSIQNAVEQHQLGTATAAFNFFRSLGSAILVAVFGAIFLGRLGVGGESLGSLQALVEEATKNGVALGPVFGTIFATAAVTLAIGFGFFVAMEERPLKAY